MASSETSTDIFIVVNGEDVQLGTSATVATLMALRKPRPPFAVELNKKLVRRGDYAAVPLKQGDHVEIVTLVGGG